MEGLDLQLDNLQEQVRNILTLRYDPRETPSLPKLTWKNFLPYEGISSSIKPSIEGAINRILKTNPYTNVGMGISGGIDSTTILSLMRNIAPNRKIFTYCVTFGDSRQEVGTAKEISELYNTTHKEINIQNPLADLEKLTKIVDAPRWNLYPYYLFKAAKEDGCQAVFTGDGGDELFGGYSFRYKQILNTISSCVEKKYLSAHNRDWTDTQKDMFMFDFEWEDIYKLLASSFDNPLPETSQIFLADYSGKLLYDFSPSSAKLAANEGVDVVAPFLEPEVLYLATHLPFRFKYDERNNIGKIILRQILLENSGFKPATWGKTGWGMSIESLWSHYGFELALKLLNKDSLCVQKKLINPKWFATGFKESDSHNLSYINKMLQLISLESWLKGKEE